MWLYVEVSYRSLTAELGFWYWLGCLLTWIFHGGDIVIYFQPLLFCTDRIDLLCFTLWDMWESWDWDKLLKSGAYWVLIVWLEWHKKSVDAWLSSFSWITPEQSWNQIPPSFIALFRSLPQGWQEFRLLRLMTWNSWNPGFRQCVHFKRGLCKLKLFFSFKEDMHTVFFFSFF